jgi:hypothetical protein
VTPCDSSAIGAGSVGVIVPVVEVRVVGVPVRDRRVPVAVRMWLARRVTRGVFVLVMEVVDVEMGMLQRFMRVFVIVRLGDVQPHAETHARHASKTRTAPGSGRALPCHDKITTPASSAAAPAAMRRSTFSRNTTHAIPMIARPSTLRSREAVDACIRARPKKSSTGPIMPPARMTSARTSRSADAIGASRAWAVRRRRCTVVTSARPKPDPR